MISLCDYQRKAVRELKAKANELLELDGNRTIIFKAPTGSGKTLMMAEFLKDFVEYRGDSKTFSFIWAAPRKLHDQSKEKLERYYEDSMALVCSSFEDLNDKRIGENEILFVNWESINKKDNIYVRDNERDFNLTHIIQNTKDAGNIVILIIDESHHTAGAKNTQGLIEIIDPKLTFEVSATPDFNSPYIVPVERQAVIEEGMIKKRIVINPGFKNEIIRKSNEELKVVSDARESTNEFVLRMALQKRKALSDLLDSEGSDVNPLLLVQLPDANKGREEVKDEVIAILKNKHKITVENGKLAIYLSEDKENLEAITQNNDEAEVMIFKQAIALGWDCPRASILVLFRDWKSIVFSVQTVGRILRMPEIKHYQNDALNVGYVYTNLEDISIQVDVAGGYITTLNAKRIEEYEKIGLRSVHSKRFREETRLTPLFINKFLEAAEELKLADKIDIDINEIDKLIITSGEIDDVDETFDHLNEPSLFQTHKGETVSRKLTRLEVQKLFDDFVIESLKPLAPEARSFKRVNSGIYTFFKTQFHMVLRVSPESAEVQMVVLSDRNRHFFVDTINRAKELYAEEVGKGKKELVIDKGWEVPVSMDYDENYIALDYRLSVLQPYYEKNSASKPEKEFAEYLDSKGDEIEWWFKNGDRDGTYFAVPYNEGEDQKPFYVDWIVKYKDGRIGLFDTKAGITAASAKSRAEGLARYIADENKRGKKLFGGIVVYHKGSWRLNDHFVYDYKDNDFADWKFL